ncbi:MAG: SH2 domain-containing protein, partial [Allorhizobium sp.]
MTATPSAGFVLNGQAFASLPAVVAAHQHVLRSPLVHPLKGCRWFRGFLTYEQSVALLAGRPPGTFLLRFSRSQPGSLAVAFTAEDGKVQQSIV